MGGALLQPVVRGGRESPGAASRCAADSIVVLHHNNVSIITIKHLDTISLFFLLGLLYSLQFHSSTCISCVFYVCVCSSTDCSYSQSSAAHERRNRREFPQQKHSYLCSTFFGRRVFFLTFLLSFLRNIYG